MKADAVFDCLEMALYGEWESCGAEELPAELKDAVVMVERGRRLL